MTSHAISSHLKNFRSSMFVAALLAVSIVSLCGVGVVSSRAQDTPDAQEEERKFENTIPQHVPIKVKLKNEQSFKNVKNRKWARELEIEVKNTGSKPIYFMYLVIVMPDVIVNNHPSGFQVTYGRKELVRLTAPLNSDDVPILPGETTILKISQAQVRGFEKTRDEEKRGDAKKVEFDLQLINFGDGTGVRSKLGRPYPDPATKRSSNVSPIEGDHDANSPTSRVQETDLQATFLKSVAPVITASSSHRLTLHRSN